MQPLSLYELNNLVHEVLALQLPETFWVVAEISDFREASNGHAYLELIEQEPGAAGSFKAKARANIWRTTWMGLKARFMRESGRSLTSGLKILAEVAIQFHEVYGYSLTILDIDPTYTLGEQQRKRQLILQQLEKDGVLTLNQELELPSLVQRIAVVSAAGAAGYGDFMHQLEQSSYSFTTHLYAATMQGTQVAESVIAALDRIAKDQDSWDAVVIIRGGGATSDLDGFENYDLAANVAQFPLPIITGIGHERDDTVIDFVAHTRCKTPTAVAAFLIDRMQSVYASVQQLEQRLHRATEQFLHATQQHFTHMAQRYSTAAVSFVNQQTLLHQRMSQRIAQGAQQQLFIQHRRLQQAWSQLQHQSPQLIERRQHQLSLFAQTLRWADPQRMLAMGYSITYTAEGKLLNATDRLSVGTRLRTLVADGEVWSETIEL